jgi:hypothetical protein
MKYTYTITEDLRCIISSDGQEIDNSGPWESLESASAWAKDYVDELNFITNEEGEDVSD